jgi:surface antigen
MKSPLAAALAALLLTGPAYADPDHNRHDDRREERRDHQRDDDRRHDDGARDRRAHDDNRRDHAHDRDDAPRHPPAHGWYKDKHPNHPKYRGKSGVVYVRDYGVRSGHCDRDAIGTAVGAAAGVVIGGQIAGREDRAAGMIVGGVLGAVLGHAVGDSLDNRDRACMGHALELGAPGVPVVWRHAGHRYHFVPGRDARDGCRHATLKVDGQRPKNVLACPAGRGDWTFRRN